MHLNNIENMQLRQKFPLHLFCKYYLFLIQVLSLSIFRDGVCLDHVFFYVYESTSISFQLKRPATVSYKYTFKE